MNAYKAVLTDVDGTLVDSKGRVTEKTAAGIREWICAGGRYAIVKSSPILLEVMRAGINKGDAVRRLCRYWGIGVDETVVFGDSYNDMEMLEIGGCTIVMGNAPEDIRTKFSHVTEDNDHDGIYYGMKSLGLIP